MNPHQYSKNRHPPRICGEHTFILITYSCHIRLNTDCLIGCALPSAIGKVIGKSSAQTPLVESIVNHPSIDPRRFLLFITLVQTVSGSAQPTSNCPTFPSMSIVAILPRPSPNNSSLAFPRGPPRVEMSPQSAAANPCCPLLFSYADSLWK